MGQVIGYDRSNRAAVNRYLEAGFLAIDNDAAERASRPVAVGRKNRMCCGSDGGGWTAAVLFGLMATCKGLGLDPFCIPPRCAGPGCDTPGTPDRGIAA
jgi:transposase